MSGENNATVSTDLLRLLAKFATVAGIEAGEIIPVTELASDAEARFPFPRFASIANALIRKSEDPCLGLHFGEAMPSLTRGQALSTLMMNSATVGEALERLCRYHGLLTDGVIPELRDDGRRLKLRINPRTMPERHYADAVLGLVCATLAQLTQDRVRPSEVCFSYPQPMEVEEYRRIFGRLPLFGQADNSLSIDRKDRALPIFLANPDLMNTLESYAQRAVDGLHAKDIWTHSTFESIGEFISKGEKPRLREIARAQGISPRHLHNKLLEEGSSYRAILDAARKRIAADSLRRGKMTICEIAFMLGFSEQSSFTHAFKRWTGMTPGEYTRAERKL